MKVSFIGLGAMGFPMAGHLAQAGHDVTVYNRTASKAKLWLSTYDGNSQSTPALACKNAEVVFLCLGNDKDLKDVVLGEKGALSALSDGAILVDHTTTSAEIAREIAQTCSNQGIAFLDAPVSGGQAGAVNAKLSVMLGGNESVYNSIIPLLNCYSQKHQLMGSVGAGQLTKMVNQICIAGVVQGLSEALLFAQNAGLEVDKVIDVISKGAAQSWQMENRWSTMIKAEFDFGFAVDWMRKDLGIMLDEAKRNTSALPVTALVDQFYAQIQNNGGNRYDTSSLISLLDKKSR
ncbi:MAG: 3-hydroxyisobutyrate dehydrogenase-like beta-hydroxyacid dehydrogenase [Kangiellaceae bacterium]|jgi:3-hydroxyisobutyrate dehydrogenase-like beta-hydroxyacid dehydrogenase